MLMLTCPPIVRNEHNQLVASLRECADDFLTDLAEVLVEPDVIAAFELVRYWKNCDEGELSPNAIADRLSDALFDLQVTLGMAGATSFYLTMGEYTARAFANKLTAEACRPLPKAV